MLTEWFDLDGVLVRVVLDSDGVPLAVEPVSIVDPSRFYRARSWSESPEQYVARHMDWLLEQAQGDDADRHTGVSR